MASRLKVVRTVPSLRRALELYRKSGERIALVPTMGALHRGHMALVREARQRAKRVVVSIFVNPTQFAPHEDFANYPRSFATDLKALRESNVDLVWAPSVEAMYPAGFATRLRTCRELLRPRPIRFYVGSRYAVVSRADMFAAKERLSS